MSNRDDDDLTIGSAATTPASALAGGRGSHKFAPGAIVAGRYRLVALAGRGGMGEVYRAEDLTLDQPVALKFLPAGVAADPARLAQFHNELRIARQVSHKNVVRLYDLGEADGRRFITMEYVDGEDLASLLRRIGRLPQDKAVEIARQLCAAVAAAHERGVLHRDLKPANVMLDGDGHVRVTDFGLAIPDSDTADTGTMAGTPQYMAPEQLNGQPASVKTDLYSLGLILFEIFTGKRAFEAKTLRDLQQLHSSGTITTPSSVVRDLDPSIERVILRCLEREPTQRPASALAVAAALPGGDPIAAALAAGETPSPEMLAKAGEIDAVPAGRALGAALVFVAAVVAFTMYSPHASIMGLAPVDKPAAVLEDRAQQILASIGYTDAPGDHASGFSVPPDYPAWLADTRTGPFWWRTFRSGPRPALQFWYRTSPTELIPLGGDHRITPTDPASVVPRMRTIKLDTLGRLAEFYAIPPDHDPHGVAASPNWKPLFEAAGLDMARFRSVEPEWSPRAYADARSAWEGPWPDRPEITVRIEAAAFRGKPTSFLIVGPWTKTSATSQGQLSLLATIGSTFAGSIWTLGLLVAAFIARHNLNAGRADRRGAARLSIGLIVAEMIGWVVAVHHVATPNVELELFAEAMERAIYDGVIVWIVYLALEPYARRFWPDSLLGWTRFFSGRIRDPRVGRDVLVGLLCGVALLALDAAHAVTAQALNTPLQPMFGTSLAVMQSPARVLAVWASFGYSAVISALFIALVFIVLRLVTPKPWMAAAAGVAIITGITDNAVAFHGGWVELVFALAVISACTAVLFRYGLLPLAIALFADNMVGSVPMTLRFSLWWAGASTLTITGLLVLSAFAFYAARAGQPLFGGILTRE